MEGTCASHGTTFLTGILCALLFKHHIAVKSKTGAEEKNADSQSIVTFQGWETWHEPHILYSKYLPNLWNISYDWNPLSISFVSIYIYKRIFPEIN